MKLQPIYNIAQICALHGIRNAILSPGSRCAPLTISFARHPDIDTKTITDERSAAFIALGMAQQLKQPVVLICTSGSAAYNYAPAIAEAYFQQIPLIVLTADRPAEWIDQLDGQTICQQGIYGRHVKKSLETPQSFDHEDAKWHCERIISDAINEAQAFPSGPVHINVPLREPFYPEQGEKVMFDPDVKVIQQNEPKRALCAADWDEIGVSLAKFKNILILGGQESLDKELNDILSSLGENNYIPIIGDVISNLHDTKGVITHGDAILFSKNDKIKETLQPDLLISFGKSIISKNLKLFLRRNKPTAHWHIQEAGQVADTFQSLTKVISTSAKSFLKTLPSFLVQNQTQRKFQQHWKSSNSQTGKFTGGFLQKSSFGEFQTVNSVLENLPAQVKLHLANSMAVRLANFVGINKNEEIEVFANRGTSGIDGSNSTAFGAALTDDTLNLLITGDLAFFYDRNAFWNNYTPDNLRIILLNNHAGGIFGIINGPSQQPELEEYFETKQSLNASNLAKDFDIDYLYCNSQEGLQNHLVDFYTRNGKIKILEVETDNKLNKTIFNSFKNALIEGYEI